MRRQPLLHAQPVLVDGAARDALEHLVEVARGVVRVLAVGRLVGAHFANDVAKAMKIDKAVSDALRNETALPTARLVALRDFTLLMLRNHGNASDAEISKFLSAGYTHQNMLEVVLGLAQKTISNYINHLARTPVDKQYEKYAWSKWNKIK